MLPSWNRRRIDKPGGFRWNAHVNDGRDIGVDASGGFHDAGGRYYARVIPLCESCPNPTSKAALKSACADLSGVLCRADHNKYTIAMTSAFATLGLGAVMNEDGYRAAGEWDNMARTFAWGMDWLYRQVKLLSDAHARPHARLSFFPAVIVLHGPGL